MLKSKEEIINWLEKYKIENYTINKDLTVDVDGNINLYGNKLKKIPVKFSKINGYFDCSSNKLDSLEFCPKEIGGDFNCSDNQLMSLKYCPEIINGLFYCSNNKLTSLEFCPKEIQGSFDCSKNQLNSLEFCPQTINGNFYLEENSIKKEKLYLFNNKIKGRVICDFGNKEEFLSLVQEQKILYEKESLIKKLENKEDSQLNKKRL